MNRAFLSALFTSCVAGASILAAPGQEPTSGADRYLTWNAAEAEAIGKAMYERGRVGGFRDTRMLKTDRSYNYKLAATWLTPDVIKATARLAQLRSRLSDDETRQLVAQALGAGDTVVMVEIDPRDAPGVIHSRGNTLEATKVRPGRIADRTSSAPVAIWATA